MSERNVGRPKKRPNYDHEKTMQQLLDQAASLMETPYDDRDLRDSGSPSLNFVAGKLHTTMLRVRKLLITADYYSTAISRNIQALAKSGMSVAKIAEKTGLSEASVYSYLPYSKGIYNMDERTLNAERGRMFIKRKQACEQLKEHLNQPDEIIYMWSAILAFQGYPFKTPKGYSFKYRVDDETLYFTHQKNGISKATVERAFRNARSIQKEKGYVNDPKKLGTIGAAYLYQIFLRIGVCEKEQPAEK